MTRPELRIFLKTAVDSLNPATEFGYGLITNFNSLRTHTYPAIWWATKQPTSSDLLKDRNALYESWEVNLIIASIDKMDSFPIDYEALIDKADEIAQKLIFAYNQIISGYKFITIEGINRMPFIKQHADCLTGIELAFMLKDISQVTNCE